MDAEAFLRALISDLSNRTGFKSKAYGPHGVSFQSGGYSVSLDATGSGGISIHLTSSEIQQLSVLPGDSALAVRQPGTRKDAKSPVQIAKALAKWLDKGKGA